MDIQSSNPTLNERTFGAARVGVGEPAMTIQGTVNKTFILLAVLVPRPLGPGPKSLTLPVRDS